MNKSYITLVCSVLMCLIIFSACQKSASMPEPSIESNEPSFMDDGLSEPSEQSSNALNDLTEEYEDSQVQKSKYEAMTDEQKQIAREAKSDDVQNILNNEEFIVDQDGYGEGGGKIAIFNSYGQQIHMATFLNLSSIPEFSKKNQGVIYHNVSTNIMNVSITKRTDEPDDSPDGFNVRYEIDCNSWTLSKKEYWANRKYVGNVKNEVTDQRLIEIAIELKERLYQTE